jgi:NADH:ubiquinone oxidoreductase subunit K
MLVFCSGVWGLIVVKGNVITLLISLELLVLSCVLNFVVFAYVFDDLLCQVFALLILTLAAAESALGLALIVLFYRLRFSVSVGSITNLKGLKKI